MIALKFTWNPLTGIDLGFLTIHFYSLMFVVAFSLGYYLTKKVYNNEGIAQEKLDSLFIYAVVSILIGARLGHVLFYQDELLSEDPLSVFLPFRFNPEFEFTGFRGLASHGAFIVGMYGMYRYNKKVLKKSMLWVLDRVSIPVALGAVFVRLGNFFNSEMVGKITDSSLGIKFIQDEFTERRATAFTKIDNGKKALRALTEDPQYADVIAEIPYRYPGQLMEAAGYVIVFFIILYMYWKTKASEKLGLLFGTFVLLLMGVRLIVENFKREQVEGREDWILGLNTGQILSIPFILIGIYLVFTALNRKDKEA
ncbi:prolipoprotein diacylglyceryl transferase [uncultured Dokdonia sp.]|uniref:prolipoprotein diacylglyceryl transferase n=1 Tax=uncultured Dokdonia sp. TaxID=575653 RepID=UPI00260EF985|nr:prolipoprotein diacylglyceryl transferase [uncultured Dokdonia sp.]